MDLISSVVVQGWWYLYVYDIPLSYEYYKRYGPHLTGLGQQADHSMTSNYTQNILSCYPGSIGKNSSLNHVPRQWCIHSGPRLMIPGWIWYATTLLELYEACTTYDRGGPPHRPWHDLQLHPSHTTQLLPWILEETSTWTMLLISGVVVQEW